MELKAKGVDDVYLEYFNTGKHDLAQVYLKTEADKVIADLEESHKMEVEQLLMEIVELKAQKAQAEDDCAYWKGMAQKNAADNEVMAKQRAKAFKKERHSKYKRCLAMAERCETNVYNIRRKPLCDMDDHEGWQHDDEFWQRWHKRWLGLAEKFKEAK